MDLRFTVCLRLAAHGNYLVAITMFTVPNIAIALPSVQSLFLQFRFQGEPLSTGTGFVAQSPRGPVLLTNRHNVTGRNNQTGTFLNPQTAAVPDEVVIVHNRASYLGEWTFRIEPLLRDYEPLWYEHPVLGPSADFVALPLTKLEDVALYPYNLTGDPLIRCGPADVVSVVGFPFGLVGGGSAGGALAVWATGFVAFEPEINYDCLPMFLIDCRSRPGQSGSAVIAYRSAGMVAMEDGGAAIFGGPVQRLLGIYSGRINQQSDLGMVWKTSALKELVDTIR